MSRRLRTLARRAGIAVLALLVGLTAFFLLLHLPWIQSRVGRFAAARLAARGIALEMRAISYNLASLSVHVEGVTAASTADRAAPFLEAARLDVQLPRSIFSGALALSSLTGDGLRIVVVRRRDGSTNLPASQGGGAKPSRVDVGTVALSDISIDWRDEILDAASRIEGANVELRPDRDGSSGTLSWTRPASVRAGQRETNVTANARIAWNGSQLSIGSLALAAPEASLTVTGMVGVLETDTPIALDATGTADVSRVAAWFDPARHPAGRVTFKVHATGTAADPKADITLASTDLGWQKLTDVSAEISAAIDRSAATISAFNVRALGGTATGRGLVRLAAHAPSQPLAEITIDWRDLDAARLFETIGQRPPVAIRFALDGHATASLTAWRLEALTGAAEVTTRSAPASGASIGLNGRVALNIREGQFQGTFEQWLDRAVHLEGRADGRLSPTSLPASTIASTVNVAAESWPELWGLLRRLNVIDLAPPAQLPGHARAELVLSGRIADPALAGTVEATLPDVSQVPVGGRQNLQGAGELLLSGIVAGTVGRPTIQGRVIGEALAIAGQQFNRLDGTFNMAGPVARVETLTLQQADGSLNATGTYDLRTKGLTVSATASNFRVNPVPGTQPGEVLVPLRAQVSGEWQSDGTIDALRGSGRLALEGATVSNRDLGRVAAQLTLADRRLHASIDLGDLATTAMGTLALDAPGDLTIDAQTKDADLVKMAGRLGVAIPAAITGTATIVTHVEGTRDDLAHLRATVDFQRFDGMAGSMPVRAAQPARGRYDGRVLDVADLSLQVGSGQLRAAGQIGASAPGTLAATLDADARELRELAVSLLPADSALTRINLDGQVHLEIRAPGSFERPALTATATVNGGHVATPDQPVAADFTLRAAYDNGVVQLAGLDAKWQDATVAVTGDIPVALVAPNVPRWLVEAPPPQTSGRVRARLDSVTPAVLAPFVPAQTLSQLSGLVSGLLTLDVDGLSLASVRGQLLLDRADLTVAGIALNQQQPTRVDVGGGRARIVTWNWGDADNHVTLGGSVQLDGTPALDLTLDGALDLRAIGAFVPGATAGGQAVLKATIAGAAADPRLDGRVDLRSAEWRTASPRLALTDLNGGVSLSGDRLTLVDVAGQLNGGDVYIAGSLTHAGARLTGGTITISGHGLALAIPDPLKTEVDLELALGVKGGALTLSGSATVLGGAYREPISLASGVLQALQSSPAVVQLDEQSALDMMALDVRLTTADDIIVSNNYAQLQLAADVRIGGTVAAPTLIGRAAAREGGRIFLGGNVFQIRNTGVVDFSNPNRIEPDLMVEATTRVGGREVTLKLNGTPATLDTTLTSDPPLGQAEILSLLVTGQTQNAGALAVGSDQVIGLLSGEVLGVTGRALGLDALRVERTQDVRFDAGLVAGETDPSSRLTFGKEVTRNVELVFSQSLKDTGKLTWIIGYRPKTNVELRFVSLDNESRIYDFRHDVTIGDADRPAAPAKRPAARVGTVTFAGVDAVPERELRDRLKVKEGKEFDFFRWQEDRDRIEKFLRANGYSEARVSARRAPAPGNDAIVNLVYDLRRGPRTIVDLSGTTRDRRLRRDLQRLWEQAVADGFLIDEARTAVRSAMVRDGFVRAAVDARIDRPAENEKHLVVTVDRGQEYRRRRLAFTGQRHGSASRLAELAAAGTSPWIDPAPFVRAVTTMYRNEGYLDADVTVSAATFEGGTATLPITISEGLLFQLESVTFGGLAARSEDEAKKAFGLKPGAPVTRANLDEAVQKLTRAYRSDGFNKVRVTVTSDATRATGQVAVALDIDEGARQVLRDVTIDGTRRTSPSLVRRELKLDSGKPVDLSELAQARKRLYDTSMFRQVDVQAVPIEPPDGAPAGAVEQPTRARVTVDEWPPLRVRYGFEVNDEPGPLSEARVMRPGFAADATHRNVFGRSASTGLAARVTKDFNAARVFWSMPSFFGLPLETNVFVARSREEFSPEGATPYFLTKSTLTAEQRFRAGRRLQLGYSFTYDRAHHIDANFDPDDPFALDSTIDVARLTATALVDTRDDLVDATRGLLTSSTFEYGIGALGSSVSFGKFSFQQNYYRTLTPRLVFATSGRVGLAAAFGQELLPDERFHAGGSHSVRGFAEDVLGPVDVFGPGGNGLLAFNEELRFPIFGRFRGVGFLDAGNTFETIGDISLGQLRAGAGLGLRVQTPFALLRADVATPISRRPTEQRWRFYFSIGQSF